MSSVTVSGVGVPNQAVAFPSGLYTTGEPGSNLHAFLASLNANFGFNLTPHTFQMEFVPIGAATAFHGASGQLLPIGSFFELFIGEFYLRGNTTHADYITSNAGTLVNITVEDDRKELRRVKIHTEDLGDEVPSGVISVARAYRQINGLTDINGDPSDPLIREYERILDTGATYSQILAAIDFAFNEGRSAVPISILPTVDQLELNIGGTIAAIRWKFNLAELDEALTRVLQDTGFDWYWGMDAQRVQLVNKKVSFDIEETDILDLVTEFGSASGLNSTKQTGFGQDVIADPTRFRLLGGHQRGFINSPLLSPLDGLETEALDGNVLFTPIWDRLTIGFNDGDGFYRTYKPTEKELQLALAGIEQWTYFKKYQTADPSDDPPGFGLPQDEGSVAAQHYAFESRLDPLQPLSGDATGAGISGIRIIANRRDEQHNWVNAFYERLRDHSSRHYGRSYAVEGLLFNEASGLFRLADNGWANVENQLQGAELSQSGTVGGLFTAKYEINRRLGPISPFVTDDFRVIAHCVLPADTVYGPQGDDVPTSFGNWTEDAPPFNPSGDGSHYVPVNLTVVGQRIIDPRNDDLYAFEAFPEGTLYCQLPINAGPASGLVDDGVLSNLVTLITTRAKLSSSGIRDLLNPALVLNAYPNLSGVAIPIESRLRYGQSFPTSWVDGPLHYQQDEHVQLDDQFVPWGFFPVGSQTSLDVMTEHAMRRVTGKTVPRSSSRHADFLQVGLPVLSFDAFSNQSVGPSGLYGEVSHGVNELNITFGNEGFATRYKIQSYFPKFGKEAPLGERTRAILNGILNPIDFTFLELGDPIPAPANDPFLVANPLLSPVFFDSEKRAVRVTIFEVNNVFELGSDPATPKEERYRGRDRHGYDKPPEFASTNPDFTEGAICIDGYLNPDDEAIYHTDEFQVPDGKVIARYFTQGRKFGNSTIVEIARVNSSNSANYDVTIVDPTAEAEGINRAVLNLPVLNGTVTVGGRTTTAVQGDAAVKPGNNSDGIYLNGVAAGGGTPVEITSLQNVGQASALAAVRPLGPSGITGASVSITSGVFIIPFPQLAQTGDKGLLVSTAQSGITTNYVQITRQGFARFGA